MLVDNVAIEVRKRTPPECRRHFDLASPIVLDSEGIASAFLFIEAVTDDVEV